MRDTAHTESGRLRQNAQPVLMLLALVLLLTGGMLFRRALRSFLDGAQESYAVASQEMYEEEYERFRERGEQAYHVQNRAAVAIDLSTLRKENRLEVLRFRSSALVHSDDRKYWQLWSGSGAYTVNLQAGEYITDNERAAVYIYLPSPVLDESVELDGTPMQQYELTGDGFFSTLLEKISTSSAMGEEAERKMIKEASESIKSSMIENELYYEAAKENAVSTVRGLVYACNPDIPNLTVEVDFY